MNHTTSKVKVYMTDDYKLFKLVDGNRAINKNKIDKIVKEIKSGNDVLDESPILVTENKNRLEIKDGQHPFKVAEQLKRPVHYIIKKEAMSIYNVARVNSNTEKWSGKDFINAYSQAGNPHYIQLGKFHKKYKIAISTCLVMLTAGIQKRENADERLSDLFQQGKFEVKTYKDAVNLAEICKSFEGFKHWNDRCFVVAIAKILQAGKCEMDRMMDKFRKNPAALEKHPDIKGYLNNLQAIYNSGTHSQRPVY